MDWDEYFEPMPSWNGPTHSRPIGFVRAAPGVASGPLRWKPLCRHWREPVKLGEGLTVYASAWRDQPKGRYDAEWADVGFYLDPCWASSLVLVTPGFQPSFVKKSARQAALYPWPDFGEPLNHQRFARAVRWLLSQARNGRRIEIGCLGGHGRTGTTIAAMLVVQGMSSDRAIERVRRYYCDEAIETRSQEQLIEALDPSKPKPALKRSRQRRGSTSNRRGRL